MPNTHSNVVSSERLAAACADHSASIDGVHRGELPENLERLIDVYTLLGQAVPV
jgi:hypothetical protein